MKSFREYYSNALDTYPYGGASVGPGMGQYVPIADLNLRAQKEKEVKKSDIDQLEKYADRLFGSVGIDVEFTKHFLDRVNDARNKVQITTSELIRLFRQSYKKFGKTISKLGPDAQAVITDMKTDINMPFVLNLKGGKLELVAKTVMRKKDFKTPNRKLAFEGIGEPNIFSQKNPRIPRKKGQPAGSKKHSDLYTDENPRGTIHGLKFATVQDAKASVKKIENSGKKHAHKIQAAVAMEQGFSRRVEPWKSMPSTFPPTRLNSPKETFRNLRTFEPAESPILRSMRGNNSISSPAAKCSSTSRNMDGKGTP